MKAKEVLQEFSALSAVPRCSGNEKAAADYIVNLAKEAGHPYRTDDNGIAVALALAVMKDRTLPHGPLELLFTVEEETGLIGASNLGPDMIEGKYLINLDFEEDYQICIGCAGGVLTTAEGTLPAETVSAGGHEAWKLSAEGLKGGHSGMDIESSPENIYKKFVSLLRTLSDLQPRVADMTGEGKVNAIPTNFAITFLLPENREDKLREAFREFEQDFYKTYSHPGVLKFARDGSAHLEISLRSDRQEQLEAGKERIQGIFTAAGLRIANTTAYPPWPPAPQSKLVSLCQEYRRGIFDEPAEVVTIHAGLECGIISSKAGGIDAISIGPNLFDVHTTRERIQISSLEKVVRWLCIILARQENLQ